MRIYTSPMEMGREVERDLYEMGTRVHPQSMQNKLVGDDPDYLTIELMGYGYVLTQWTHEQLNELLAYLGGRWDYVEAEFKDRTAVYPSNPGKSFNLRPAVWNEFLNRDGKFDYTYSERLCGVWEEAALQLKVNPNSRQVVLPIYQPKDLRSWGGVARVPCSLNYQFMLRPDEHGEKRLHLIYSMRSCDLLTHFATDVSLACLAIEWMARVLGVKPGRLTHVMGSLHAYHKDLKPRGVF